MDLYDRIRDKISGLASILKDMNTLTPEMHQDADFSTLYDAIEKRMKESPATPSARTANDSAPGEDTGKHNINIGGNVSGDIVIGDNNQVSDLHEDRE
jgi:hypothetical protein